MSGALGGLFAPDGPEPDLETLARLSGALAHRGPDGEMLRRRPGIALVQRALSLDGGRRGAPLFEQNGLLLAWDGRLDNRAELACRLGAGADAGPDADTDLGLIARAWETWGEDFPERIVGDFALALWDSRRRCLLLARDPFGTRPLFYVKRGGELLFASTLTALRAAWPLSPEVDDEWIAGYLIGVRDVEGSPFRNLRSVPPGHTLLADGVKGVTLRRFWRLDPEREVQCRDDGEYEERFRDLFVEAVRCRLPEAEPVFAELSGGLDSSSNVCAADRLLRDGAVTTPDLVPISEVYSLSRTADESAHIRIVEQRTGRPSHRLTEEDCPILAGFEERWFEIPIVLQCFLARHRRTLGLMRERGARVLLSGIGGDQILRSQVGMPVDLANLARTGRLREIPAALRHWHREQHRPYAELLWQGLVIPLLPRSLRTRLAPPPIALPDWYDRAFARRMDLRGRMAAVGDERIRLPTRRLQSATVELAIRKTAWRYDAGPEQPMLMLYPFLHRPLVELCLALPPDQLIRPGQTRSIHRRALRDLLPPEIAQRPDKRGPMEPILRAVAAQWPTLSRLLPDARVCQRGYLDPTAFRRALDEARFGKPERKLILLQVIALEVWLRQVE
jgi:asparagine synthase (glutamine-hydrolysing)